MGRSSGPCRVSAPGCFFAHKKREEACASSPCRSIRTPLTRHCRCLKAFPTLTGPQFSAPGLRSRAFYTRVLSRRPPAPRRHQSALASPSASRACTRSACPSVRLAPSLRAVLPALAFRTRPSIGSRRFRSGRPSAVCTASSLWAFRGSRLLASISRARVALSSHPAWYGRHLQRPARVTCSVPLEHSVPRSSTLRCAFRRVGLPAGGFCLTGGSDYSREIGHVKRRFCGVMECC